LAADGQAPGEPAQAPGDASHAADAELEGRARGARGAGLLEPAGDGEQRRAVALAERLEVAYRAEQPVVDLRGRDDGVRDDRGHVRLEPGDVIEDVGAEALEAAHVYREAGGLAVAAEAREVRRGGAQGVDGRDRRRRAHAALPGGGD